MPSSGKLKRMKLRRDEIPVRLNRYLALVGVGSRRTCDEVIRAGRVSIDGKRIEEPGVSVTPGANRICIDGVALENPPHRIVMILNKPTGVVSTVSDPLGRPTVIDLCKRLARGKRIFPVGRLDINTTGAILLTNDGLLCYRLTHPRFKIPRTYYVRVRGSVTEKSVARLSHLAGAGLSRQPGHRSGTPVEFVGTAKGESILRVTLHEGKNRQVRKMCEDVGLRIIKLKRIRFGPVTIRKLPLGAVRFLEKRELELLDRITS